METEDWRPDLEASWIGRECADESEYPQVDVIPLMLTGSRGRRVGVHRRRLDEPERGAERGLEGVERHDTETAVGATNILRRGGCSVKRMYYMRAMMLLIVMRQSVRMCWVMYRAI